MSGVEGKPPVRSAGHGLAQELPLPAQRRPYGVGITRQDVRLDDAVEIKHRIQSNLFGRVDPDGVRDMPGIVQAEVVGFAGVYRHPVLGGQGEAPGQKEHCHQVEIFHVFCFKNSREYYAMTGK